MIHAGCEPCVRRTATAIPTVVGGFVVGINVIDGGCGYTEAPSVQIVGGGGNGATAMAIVTDGVVSGIVVTSAGIGYTSLPAVRIASPPFAPWLTIAVSQVVVTLHVVPGHHYILESSADLQDWTPVGTPFTADNELITRTIDVDSTQRFFRIREVP